AQVGDDPVGRRGHVAQVAGVDRGQSGPARAVHVDDAAAGHVGGEGALGLLLELRPGGVGDGGELAIEVVHDDVLLLRLPIPREPLDSDVVTAGPGSVAPPAPDAPAVPGAPPAPDAPAVPGAAGGVSR